MQTLNNRDYSSFKTLAQMTQPKLHNTVYQTLKNIYPKNSVTKTKDGVIAKGTIPVCLIAHMDTVFKSPPSEIYYDKEANVMWSPDGLGADDRAGVFAILKILSHGYRPHICFTVDEESGAIGAGNIAEQPCPFDDLKYLIELDRANAIDCVFYDGANLKFENYVESFGFVTALGSFTDIVELCPAWEVSGVNLSIGYRDEHSTSEVLFVGQMLATIDKVEKMLNDADNVDRFPFVPLYTDDDFYGYGGWNYDYYGSYKGPTFHTCNVCGTQGNSYTLIPIRTDDGFGRIWLCGDCITDKNVEWCEGCYNGYLPGIIDPASRLCPVCQKRLVRFNEDAKNSTKVYGTTGTVQSSHQVESEFPTED